MRGCVKSFLEVQNESVNLPAFIWELLAGLRGFFTFQHLNLVRVNISLSRAHPSKINKNKMFVTKSQQHTRTIIFWDDRVVLKCNCWFHVTWRSVFFDKWPVIIKYVFYPGVKIIIALFWAIEKHCIYSKRIEYIETTAKPVLVATSIKSNLY